MTKPCCGVPVECLEPDAECETREMHHAERGLYHPLAEVDPLGRNPHEPGAKLDAGKRRDGLVLLAFARALAEVSKVGTYGAQKYTENGWIDVPDGVSRYTDAMLRHMLAEASGEAADKDTGLLHAAHAAWNALARLDLMVRNAKS